MRQKVLIVDNDPDFLETRAERLAAAGYRVYQSVSIEEAERLLDHTLVHVAIIDIRLREDNDDKDVSGLELAAKEAYRAIPKIVLTRNDSYEYVREALGPTQDGLPPAVNFITKREGPAAMLHAVEQAFTRYVRINRDLIIDWEDLHSFQYLVKLIEPDIDNTQLLDYSDELEDLFRKLFYDRTQINIGRLLVRDAGLIILEIFAYTDAGAETQLALSCGRRREVHEEASRHERFAPRGAGTGSSEEKKPIDTTHFAAAAYTLHGGALAEMTSFREYYQSKPLDQVSAALEHLYKTTLAAWHKRGRFYEPDQTVRDRYLAWLDLSDDAATQAELARRIEAICREALTAGLASLDYSAHTITLQLPDGAAVSYRNPITLFAARGSDAETLCGITHGQADAETVLINGRGQTWLVDFSHAGLAPLLCDFVPIELAIKLDLLDTTDLHARHTLEQRLLAVGDLAATINAAALPPDLERALRCVEQVRRLAAAQESHNLYAYLTGLFFCAIKRVATYDPTVYYTQRRLMPYLHGLLLAAMLAEKLLDTATAPDHLPAQALNSLWIDQVNKEVWLEGRQIDLTPQDFAILAYLYNHPGQFHSRQDIMKGALGHSYDLSEESRFNSALSRLRQKIEPDANSPKYLIIESEDEYKLSLPWSDSIAVAQKFFEAANFQVELVQTDILRVYSSKTREWDSYGLILVRYFEKQPLAKKHFSVMRDDINRLELSKKLAFVVHDGQIQLAAILEIWRLKQERRIIVPLHTQLMARTLVMGDPDACYRQLRSLIEVWSSATDPYDSVDANIHPQWFFGRAKLLSEIMRHISGRSGKQIVLWGMRRVGKTAVLKQIEIACREKGYPVVKWLCKREAPEVILYNIVGEFLQSVEKLYPEITGIQTGSWEIYQQNGLARFKIDIQNIWNTARRLSNPDIRLVLLLDEIELDSFFPGERSSEDDYQRYYNFTQAIKDILESSDTSEALSLIITAEYPWINKVNRFPFNKDFQNPLFKRFKEIPLTFLKLSECTEMVCKIGGLAGIRYDEASVRSVYEKTNGHPQVTRWLCSCILEVLNQKNERKVTKEIVNKAIDFFIREVGGEPYRSYFEEVFWKNVLSPDMDSDQIVVSEMAKRDSYSSNELIPSILEDFGYLTDEFTDEVAKQTTESDIRDAINRLIEIGIIKQDRPGKSYHISIPLYASWIRVWKMGLAIES